VYTQKEGKKITTTEEVTITVEC